MSQPQHPTIPASTKSDPYISLTNEAASDLKTLCSIQTSIEIAQHTRLFNLDSRNTAAVAAHTAQLAADRRFLKAQHKLHLLREEQRRENFAVLHKRASDMAKKVSIASEDDRKRWEDKQKWEGEMMENWKKEMKEIREEAVKCYVECDEKVRRVLDEVAKEVGEKTERLVEARAELFRKQAEGPLERSQKLLERLQKMRGSGLVVKGK
jgi:hypothetical protein